MCSAIATPPRLLVYVRGAAGIVAAECVDTPQRHQDVTAFKRIPRLTIWSRKWRPSHRVLFDGPPAEIAFAHVFAQCDQPTVNLLSGNVCVSGGGCSRDDERRVKGLKIMRRKSSLETAARINDEALLRINRLLRIISRARLRQHGVLRRFHAGPRQTLEALQSHSLA